MSNFDLIIVGAGAAGMMAAISATRKGKKILLAEKMEQPGRKLRITGKGRCNLTNAKPLDDFLEHVNDNEYFIRDAFSTFFSEELIDFFENLSVPLVIERGDRVFPASGKSHDIFLALIKQIEKSSIKILRNANVSRILSKDQKVIGIELKNGNKFFSPKIILATGGKSYPLTGSTGDGYRIAKELGHTIVDTYPALVPLICKETIPHGTEGFPLKNIKISVFGNNKEVFEALGEISFTRDGITGPLILTLSRKITKELANGISFKCYIDFKPALSEEKMEKKLIRELDENSCRTFKEALRLWLPAKLQKLALQNISIPEQKSAGQFSANDREKIQKFLKHFPLTIIGTKGFNEAIITQGGVSIKEINPKTMESKIINGLYFAGEIMDLDADTGGYNLQIAFSTGYLAGVNA